MPFLFWFSMYFFTTSRSTKAIVTKYHLLQKFFCHNIFFFQCKLCNIIALFHFNIHNIHETLYFGAIFSNICTWSIATFHFTISPITLIRLHNSVMYQLFEFFPICFNDPLRSAGSRRWVLLNQESESDSKPYSSLREECET